MSATPPVATSADLLAALARLRRPISSRSTRSSCARARTFPKLCLIQAASSDACAVLDPLALPDLEPLWQFLGIARANQGAARSTAGPGSARDCDARSARARTDLRHADRGRAARSSGADRLRLARGGAPRPHAREGTHAYRLDATTALARATAVRRRRRALSRPLYLDLRDALQAAGRLDWLTRRRASSNSSTCIAPIPMPRGAGSRDSIACSRSSARRRNCWRNGAKPLRSGTTSRAAGSSPTMRCARLPSACPRRSRSRIDPQPAARRRAPTRRRADGADRARPKRRRERSRREHPPRPQPQQLALVTKLMNFARETAQQRTSTRSCSPRDATSNNWCSRAAPSIC